MACIVVMDIGGTFIKSALSDAQTGRVMLETVYEVPTNANGGSEAFFASLLQVLDHARSYSQELVGVSLCIPGPFDYEKNISHMEHKFSAIYNRSLDPFFAEQKLPVVSLHDSTAFLLGEVYYGAAQGYASAMGVMLGTGFGFSMASGGKVLVSEDQRPSVKLWNKPYEQGIVEDYVSSRAMRVWYQTFSDYPYELDVKEIGIRAESGEKLAQQLFEEVGRHIGRIIKQYIPSTSYECLVLGGQIARSHQFIIPGILESLSCPVVPAKFISSAALWGAGSYRLRGKSASVQIVSEQEVLIR